MRSSFSYPHGNLSVSMVKRSSQTRKSIKKFFPDQTKDSSNPIMLHSSDDELYPRLWSFLAETMIAQGELPSDTKEAVALSVTTAKNNFVGKEDKDASEEQDLEAQRKDQAIKYAETFLSSSDTSDNAPSFPLLNDAAKAEVALAVLLFQHLNRSVIALLGAHHKAVGLLSITGQQERRSFETCTGVRGAVHRMMAPINFEKAKPGLTNPLFASSSTMDGSSRYSADDSFDLPRHLRKAADAGEDCANALFRLVDWVESYEAQLLAENLLTRAVLQEMRRAVPPPHLKIHQLAQWVSGDKRLKKKLLKGRNDLHYDLACVLLMVQHSPMSVANSSWLKELVKGVGKDKATTIVLWWSLRLSLEEAKGL